MPNQPAPPAPTPTMAESIAWMKNHPRDHERMGNVLTAKHYANALSAMRAVEAMQSGKVEVEVVVPPDHIAQSVWFRVTRGDLREFRDVNLLTAINQALAAFPSPDGGSAK